MLHFHPLAIGSIAVLVLALTVAANVQAFQTETSSTPRASATSSFSASPTSGPPPLTVTFSDSDSGTYLLRFGDGSSGTLTVPLPDCVTTSALGSPPVCTPVVKTIAHTYKSTGTYRAKLYLAKFVSSGGAPVASVNVSVRRSSARLLCGLFRGGTDTATNMVASPNPATSVANTNAACIEYCDASGAIAGDMCRRGAFTIKSY